MSRAMNLKLAEKDVAARCAKAGIRISAIETLPSGGTHLVCVTGDDAAEMRRIFKSSLIEGPVKRFAFMHARTVHSNEPPAADRADVVRTIMERHGQR
jgi:hypothetical protein